MYCRASLRAFVASSSGTYRFCPSPDCPSIYRVADPDTGSEPFNYGVCYSNTCTKCHLEYHPFVSCERYRELKDDPEVTSLREWCKGKEQVKSCPACGQIIEKVDGCNHIECKCRKLQLEFLGVSRTITIAPMDKTVATSSLIDPRQKFTLPRVDVP